MDPLFGFLLYIGICFFSQNSVRMLILTVVYSTQSEEHPRKSFAHERVNREPPQVVPENHPREPGVTEDILFLDSEHVVYGRSDVVWRLDEQSWTDFRWYGGLFYGFFDG